MNRRRATSRQDNKANDKPPSGLRHELAMSTPLHMISMNAPDWTLKCWGKSRLTWPYDLGRGHLQLGAANLTWTPGLSAGRAGQSNCLRSSNASLQQSNSSAIDRTEA
jgi:hypothetical protein